MNSEDLKEFYHQKRILVTGGLGFIGSNLAIELVRLGARVTILDGLIPGLGGNEFNIEPIKHRVNLVIGDLSHLSHLGNLQKILSSQDIIFNLAGTHSHVDSMKNPLKDMQLTCEPQIVFLEACRKYNPKVKIIMAGTRNQYGKPHYLPVDEHHPLEPLDINGAHWLAVENYHLLYYRVYGLATCSLRLTNTYGPRHQMRHPYQGILNWFVRLSLDGKPIPLFGTGLQHRDMNYVDDVCNAFLLAARSDSTTGEMYNVGGESISLADFAGEVVKIIGKGKVVTAPFPKEQKRIEPGDYKANWHKIHKDLGWQPYTSIKNGLRKTIRFYERYKDHYW